MKKKLSLLFMVLLVLTTIFGTCVSFAYGETTADESYYAKKLDAPSVSVGHDISTGKIRLAWDAVDGAVEYRILRAESQDGEYKFCMYTDLNEYIDNNAEPGKTYYYAVCAEGKEEGSYSNWTEASGTCKLPQIKNFKVTNIESSGTPKLTWENIPGIQYYYVYSSTHEEGPYSRQMQRSLTGAYYEHRTTIVGKTYYYKVEAIFPENEEANSIPTDAVSTTRALERPNLGVITVDEVSGKPQFTWRSIYNADKYHVYRATSKNGEYLYLETVADTSYLDASAEAGKVYSYKICAVYEANEEANSALSHYSYIRCALPQPTGLKATRTSSGKPQVAWDKLSGADRYYVYRSTSQDGTYSHLASTEKAYYTDNSAEPGAVYYYKVVAVCDASEKANSIQSDFVRAGCALNKPTDLKASNVSNNGKPQIKWSPVEGADKYYVYRATSKNGTYAYLRATKNSSYVDDKAVAGKGYYYKVRAVYSSDEDMNSIQSNCVFRRCDLPKPKDLKISNVSSNGKPQITWTKVDGADKYYVYRCGTKNGTYTYLKSTTGTSYVDTSAKAGYVYYYKVRAVYSKTEDADSAQSSYVYTRCDLPQPKIKAVLSSGKPKITWDAIDGASSYVIYRKVGVNGTYRKYYTTKYTSFTNKSAEAGTKYYYKVMAVSKVSTNANSVYSNEVYITAK